MADLSQIKIDDVDYNVKDAYARTHIPTLTSQLTNDSGFLEASDITTPEAYGAAGDGTTDDTQALTNAFEAGRFIVFAKNKTYLVSSPIVVYDGTTVELCGSAILASSTGNHVLHNFEDDDTYLAYNGNGNITIRNGYIERGSIDFIHAENVVIENVGFKNCKLDHYIEICACKNFVVRDCAFVGMDTTSTSQKEYINIDNCKYSNFPWLDENSVTFDGTVVDGVLVDNCIFDINSTSMQDAVGKHSYYNTSDYTANRAKNITIRYCKVYGATDQAFLFMGADNVTIENCYIDSCKRHYLMRYCSYVKISNNNVFGMTSNNIIDNSNYVEITNNSTRLSSEVSFWDVQFQHTCNEVDYSKNEFVNYYGGRVPISFADNVVMTNLKAMFNNYVVNSTSVKSVFTLGNSSMSFSFKAVDDVHFSAGTNSNTVTGIYDLTQFNRLIVQLGAIEDNTYIECVVKSFAGRNFVAGETYYLPVNLSSTPELGFATLTITDANTLTSTGLKIRCVKCQKLPSA